MGNVGLEMSLARCGQYTDSEGGQHAHTLRPHAFRLRDDVILAMNTDTPYDKFLIQQIADYELVPN